LLEFSISEITDHVFSGLENGPQNLRLTRNFFMSVYGPATSYISMQS